MKTVEEHYQDWYNKRSGDPDMDLAIEFVDKYACEFAKYYNEQLGLFSVSNNEVEFCEYFKEPCRKERCNVTPYHKGCGWLKKQN